MRILVLCKRQYTGRDLLDDHFGRLYEIPQGLAALGHEVRGLTLSYRPRSEGAGDLGVGGAVSWESVNGLPFSPWGSGRYLRRLEGIIRSFRPDLVWTSSDAWHLVAAWLSCRRMRVPFVADLYDNYESFGVNRIPGVTRSMRVACRQALGLTLIGHDLADFVHAHYRLDGVPVLVLGNAVDRGRFRPMPKEQARAALGLPIHGLQVGTAGALVESRGIAALLEGFRALRSRFPGLLLVLAGPRDRLGSRFQEPGIVDLGVLPPEQVPLVFNALDVAVICNRDSSFGRFCYPQKFQEIVACGTPVVATGVGEMTRLLAERPDQLFPPDAPEALAECVARQLRSPVPLPADHAVSWQTRAEVLARFFECLVSESVGSRRSAAGA